MEPRRRSASFSPRVYFLLERLAEEEELSPEELDQKVFQSLPSRVRNVLFAEQTRKAKKFAVSMLQDNKKHAEAIEQLKRQRSTEIAQQQEEEMAPKIAYNNKVKESKLKIVGRFDIEQLLRGSQRAQRRKVQQGIQSEWY